MVGGLNITDAKKCHLVKDDMAILKTKHFPCIIYMREQGEPIGDVKGKTLIQIRQERKEWFETTNIYQESICRKNCLDVCRDHNNYCDGRTK
jgi:hypothetical protein